MNTLDAIFARRSVRRFTDQPVSDEQIRTLLRAAMAAPSAYNGQPWHFIVVRDRAVLDAIPEYHRYSSMLRQAPLCIVVCANSAAARIEDYWHQDCAAATQNILLAATELGLGTCWMGVTPYEERMKPVRSQFGIPQGFEPFCLIAVGYPAEVLPPIDRFLIDHVHFEHWSRAFNVRVEPVDANRELVFTVIAVRCKGKYLLCRKRGRTTWEFSGGHIEQGEAPHEAAVRELYEETGIRADSLTEAFDYHAADLDGNASWGRVFLCEANAVPAAPPAEFEMEEIRLFDELPHNMTYAGIAFEIFPRIKQFKN